MVVASPYVNNNYNSNCQLTKSFSQACYNQRSFSPKQSQDPLNSTFATFERLFENVSTGFLLFPGLR